MLPEFSPDARISEYVCGLEYLFSRMNLGSYERTEPHLWLVGKIPLVRRRIAGLLPRGNGVLICTMTWSTCSLS